MKKFKLFVTLLVCALLTLSFAACGKQSLPTLSVDSLEYERINYRDAENKADSYYYFSYEFKIDVTKAGRYTVEYDIVLYGATDNKVVSKHFEETVTVTRETAESGKKKMSGYFQGTSTNTAAKTAKLENFKCEKAHNEDDTGYVNYAIGFGTVSAVLLGGVIGYFVWLKKKETKE